MIIIAALLSSLLVGLVHERLAKPMPLALPVVEAEIIQAPAPLARLRLVRRAR